MKAMKEVGKKPLVEWLLFFLGVLALGGAAFAIIYFNGLGFLCLLPVLLGVLYVYAFFGRYSLLKRNILKQMGEEFVHLFSFFCIYVTDGFNVYNALEAILPYSSPRLKPLFEGLLKGIDEDKTVAPFLAFAKPFEDIAVTETMISIYQMVDEGAGGPYVRRFEHIFAKLSDDKYAKKRESKLSFLQTLGFLPLAGSGIAMLMLTIGVVETMGGMLGGL